MYVIEVREGVPDSFELASPDGDTVGIRDSEERGYIVEADLIVATRSGTFIFEDGRPQRLFLQSPKSDVPSPFTSKATVR